MLLQYLNLRGCSRLILMSDDFQSIAKLEFLSLSECTQLDKLPRHITNQASLRELYLHGVKRLRELPIKIGQLSRLLKMKIGSDLLISLPNSLEDLSFLTDFSIEDCPSLESLPSPLGNLSSLTNLSIKNCPSLESLPTSLANLSSLTDLLIENCSKLESLPTCFGNLFSLTNLSIRSCPNLKHIKICECPITQVDFGAASFPLSNLKRLELYETHVCRISISEDRYPRFKRLRLVSNKHLTEIAALPVNLECLFLWGCPKLDELPSFARLTSLREFEVRNCDQIEKIEGLQHCRGLEILSLHTCWEVPGIESLEQMENLRRVELRANKGSAFQSCIQTIQKWPEEITICTRLDAYASSLEDFFQPGLSPNLYVLDSFSNQDIFFEPELLHNHFSNGNAIMPCFVIKRIYSSEIWLYHRKDNGSYGMSSMEIGEGRWAVIGVFTKRSRWFTENDAFHFSYLEGRVPSVQVERGLLVGGEEQRLVEALLTLLQSICR
ncbi:putative disease resistance protein At4g19050 [Cryptomeria japonica]|uniref:putative disease resistance protein At4g19050 n=1 Tax=Cryptomeria japonica TaxID=3369 RepID=UPI0027DA90A5|nr:putative disease resistance protein At4g19050 [Cryptomeria japonica]